ncbi:MAG: hypothetical protein KDC84_14610 [Crocinitomicaceae bacterium]|nr:hypothetical protein [Crocinitomicaceae bacterium]
MAQELSGKQKKIIELLTMLNSKDEKESIHAVSRLKVHGDESVLEPLLDKFMATKSDELKNEILIFFSELKSTKAPAVIMPLLKKNKFKDAQALILNTMWNSGLDYSQNITDLCEIAIDGDFMVTFECFTILDNINDGDFLETDINDANIILKEYFSANQEDSQKNAILQDMLSIVTAINTSL